MEGRLLLSTTSHVPLPCTQSQLLKLLLSPTGHMRALVTGFYTLCLRVYKLCTKSKPQCVVAALHMHVISHLVSVWYFFSENKYSMLAYYSGIFFITSKRKFSNKEGWCHFDVTSKFLDVGFFISSRLYMFHKGRRFTLLLPTPRHLS